MPHERLRPSFVFDEEKIKQLKQIAPEAFADGNINWEVLKQALGEHLEEEGAEAEHFGLFWPGKREARKLASTPSKGALIPAKGEGIDEDKTKNIFIEGENLEVLKLLQKSYAGKIKMIYIDPPYNTGNDFVYDDNFTEPLEEYLKYTGQINEEGNLLTTNKRADGRFHSKWLSMMYPRLRLARNLLREDGVIFISIDDNEVTHLRKICDEIFGEENFITTVGLEITKTQGMKVKAAQEGSVVKNYEYVLIYAKSNLNKNIVKCVLYDLNEGYDTHFSFYIERKNDDLCVKKLVDILVKNKEISKEFETLGLLYGDKIKIDDLEEGIQKSEKIKKYIFEEISGEIYQEMACNIAIDDSIMKKLKGKKVVEYKDYLLTLSSGGKIRQYSSLKETLNYCDGYKKEFGRVTIRGNLWKGFYSDMMNVAKEGNIEFKNGKKPIRLIKQLAKWIGVSDGEVILDFFAGSSTSAHAILEYNIEYDKHANYIMVQLPEQLLETDKEQSDSFKLLKDIKKPTNVAELSKERIRRSRETLKGDSISNFDDGFKVFKLDKSNFKQWQDYKGKDPKELTSLFKEHEIPLIDGWKPENLLIEVMLQEGFPLDSEIAELKEHKKNAVVQVKSKFCEHKLLVCFDKKIYQETINALNIQGEDIFVCLDSALSDEQKITLRDRGFLKTI